MILVPIPPTIPLLMALFFHDLVGFQDCVQDVSIICIVLAESLQWEIHVATLIPAHSLSLVYGSAGTGPSICVVARRSVLKIRMCFILATAVTVVGLLLRILFGNRSGAVVLRFGFGLAANIFLTVHGLAIGHASHERSTTVVSVHMRHNITILARASVGTI